MSKRLFSQSSVSSLSMPAKSQRSSSRGTRKGKVTLTNARGVRKATKKKKGAVTRAEVARIAKGVLLSKCEQKYFYDYAAGQTVGQVNGNATGHNSIAIGYPAPGSSATTRNGNKIYLRGLNINCLFSSMASTCAATKIICYLVWFQGEALTVDIAHVFDPNQMIFGDNLGNPRVYDSQVFRDTDSNLSIKILASWETYLKEATAITAGVGQQVHGSYNKYILLNIEQSFDDNGNPATGELYLYTLSEVGNRSAATACTLTGVPIVSVNTGYIMQIATKLEFADP